MGEELGSALPDSMGGSGVGSGGAGRFSPVRFLARLQRHRAQRFGCIVFNSKRDLIKYSTRMKGMTYVYPPAVTNKSTSPDPSLV